VSVAAGIKPEEAFRHVHEHYRWLAAAACSWNDWPSFTPDDHKHIDRLLPNVHVALQASALIYARGLIEFYDRATNSNPLIRDIKAAHFDINVATERRYSWLVANVKPSIDQHLAHISEYREPALHINPKSPSGRIDWSKEIPHIADELIHFLDVAQADPKTRCRNAFIRLHDATKHRRADRFFDWPTNIDP
jgi:hypothetical protein